jgi:hypothetical protein
MCPLHPARDELRIANVLPVLSDPQRLSIVPSLAGVSSAVAHRA